MRANAHHASDMLVPRNVVAFGEVPIFQFTWNDDLPGGQYTGQPYVSAEVANHEVETIASSNVQLSSIPDKLIFCVCKFLCALNAQTN